MFKKPFNIPLINDPKHNMGSITYTMLWLSFNYVMGLAILNTTAYLGYLYNLLHTGNQVTVSYFNLEQPIYFLTVTASLYFGRQYTTNGSKDVTNQDK